MWPVTFDIWPCLPQAVHRPGEGNTPRDCSLQRMLSRASAVPATVPGAPQTPLPQRYGSGALEPARARFALPVVDPIKWRFSQYQQAPRQPLCGDHSPTATPGFVRGEPSSLFLRGACPGPPLSLALPGGGRRSRPVRRNLLPRLPNDFQLGGTPPKTAPTAAVHGA